ncbi:MAG: VOC family protein [Anaerolineales bacterium]|nr:VOC family protein [Anaerolineales bacterium]
MKIPQVPNGLDIDLPKVGQLGFAVRSVEDNLNRFSTLFGIHTWYKPKYAQKQFQFNGQDFDLDLDLAVGFSGGLQIELLVGTSVEENPYSRHITDEGEGLHHLGFFTSKFDRSVQQLRDAGVPSVLSGRFKTKGGGSVRFEYFDTRDNFGTTIELVDVTLYGIRFPQTDFMMRVAALTGDVDRI